MARAAIYLMNLKKSIYDKHVIKGLSYLNAGSGEEIAIKNLAQIIKKVVGYKGKIKFDLTMPDGSPRKFLDSKHLNNLGWLPKINLKKGLQATYKDFKDL